MVRMTQFALIAALAASPALAQSMPDTADLIRSRDITGGDIYTLNTAVDDMTWESWSADGYDSNWRDIGSIEDIILSKDGQMIGIVAEIGGFLDIGDKHVMIPMKDVRLTPVDDQRYVLVTRMTEEQLEELEAVDEGWWN